MTATSTAFPAPYETGATTSPGDRVGRNYICVLMAKQGGRPPGIDPRSVPGIAVLMVPVVVMAWMGWQHRWMCDDAFINFRIVKQLFAGHGPVFNIGDRVEAGTSPLWLGVLAFFDAVTPVPIEWIAVFASIGATIGGLAFAVFGTRRALLTMGATGTFLPLGALVYAVLPPAWDFATSGLEVGLGLLWLGFSWWLLTGRIATPGTPRRAVWKPWWVPVVLGLGPLVRPDFLIFSAFFLLALLLVGDIRAGWKPNVAALGLAAALPFATELFRMGYYGLAVPNTAIAKEGSLSNWSEGWYYLRDFAGPHLLLVPLFLLGALLVVLLIRRTVRVSSSVGVVFGLTIVAALVHGLYVVKVGGDYMHGRMLLPPLFALLLPVSVIAARAWQWVAVTAVVVWISASAFVLRPSYSKPLQPSPTWIDAAFDHRHIISDERLVLLRGSLKAHPVMLADFAEYNVWADGGLSINSMVRAGDRGLLLDPTSVIQPASSLIPLRSDERAPIVVFSGAVGLYAYAAGNSVKVVDLFGIVDWLSAHLRLQVRARPGHEKQIPAAWMFARFAQSGAPIPNGISPKDVAAAARALTCGDFPRLEASVQGSLGLGRILSNIGHAVSLSGFRFSPEPQTAELELCGN